MVAAIGIGVAAPAAADAPPPTADLWVTVGHTPSSPLSGTDLVVTVTAHNDGPDTADRTTSDSVIVRKGPSQGERYVRGTFPIILERDPDATALAYWAGKWNRVYRNGQGRAIDTPYGLLTSNEYRRLRIRQSYLAILGRAAKASDLTYWVGRSAKGTTYDKIDQFLFGSKEFRTKHPTDGVATVFGIILHREPTAEELSTWNARTTESQSFAGLAAALQHTTGYWSIVMNDRFQRALGRDANASDRYVWFYGVVHGITVERLWAGLLTGGEYLQKYPRTEDDYGYPIFEFKAEALHLS
jgi:hypothetical protein